MRQSFLYQQISNDCSRIYIRVNILNNTTASSSPLREMTYFILLSEVFSWVPLYSKFNYEKEQKEILKMLMFLHKKQLIFLKQKNKHAMQRSTNRHPV